MSGNGEQNVKKNPEDEYRKKAIHLLFMRETYRRSLAEGRALDPSLATRSDLDKLKKHYSIARALESEQALSRDHKDEYIVSGVAMDGGFFPFDRNRARFNGYMNSSWVNEFKSDQWWIAMRMPQELLLHRFFSMFFDSEERPPDVPNYLGPIRTVVQLNTMKSGTRVSYLPQKDETKVIKDKFRNQTSIKVTVIVEETREEENCVKRVVELERGNFVVYFIHLLFRDWPDKGVPKST